MNYLEISTHTSQKFSQIWNEKFSLLSHQKSNFLCKVYKLPKEVLLFASHNVNEISESSLSIFISALQDENTTQITETQIKSFYQFIDGLFDLYFSSPNHFQMQNHWVNETIGKTEIFIKKVRENTELSLEASKLLGEFPYWGLYN